MNRLGYLEPDTIEFDPARELWYAAYCDQDGGTIDVVEFEDRADVTETYEF